MWKKLPAVYALVSTACASWQTERAPAPRAVEESAKKGEEAIRIELKSGVRYEMFAASVVGDSIIGRNTPRAIAEAQRIAVATADIRTLSRHKLSIGRTIAAVVAISAAAALIVGASGSSSSSSTSNSSCGSTTA